MVLVPYNWCRAKKVEGVLRMVDAGKQGIGSRVRRPINGQTRCIERHLKSLLGYLVFSNENATKRNLYFTTSFAFFFSFLLAEVLYM